jgi:hypothetical protein
MSKTEPDTDYIKIQQKSMVLDKEQPGMQPNATRKNV